MGPGHANTASMAALDAAAFYPDPVWSRTAQSPVSYLDMFTGSGGCSRGARRRLEPYFLSALVAPLVAERVLHPSWLRLQIPTALTLGVDDRIWPLQALDCARVA